MNSVYANTSIDQNTSDETVFKINVEPLRYQFHGQLSPMVVEISKYTYSSEATNIDNDFNRFIVTMINNIESTIYEVVSFSEDVVSLDVANKYRNKNTDNFYNELINIYYDVVMEAILNKINNLKLEVENINGFNVEIKTADEVLQQDHPHFYDLINNTTLLCIMYIHNVLIESVRVLTTISSITPLEKIEQVEFRLNPRSSDVDIVFTTGTQLKNNSINV